MHASPRPATTINTHADPANAAEDMVIARNSCWLPSDGISTVEATKEKSCLLRCLSCLQQVRTEGMKTAGKFLESLYGVSNASPQRKDSSPATAKEEKSKQVFDDQCIRRVQTYLLGKVHEKPLPRVAVQGEGGATSSRYRRRRSRSAMGASNSEV